MGFSAIAPSLCSIRNGDAMGISVFSFLCSKVEARCLSVSRADGREGARSTSRHCPPPGAAHSRPSTRQVLRRSRQPRLGPNEPDPARISTTRFRLKVLVSC